MLFKRDSTKISWKQPNVASDDLAAAPRHKFIESATATPGPILARIIEENSVVQAMSALGLPVMEGATPDEELYELLKAAAEVEHGLLIQYLYSAYSCTNAAIATSVVHIAIEEMGHLLTVQNMLLALGKPPYLGRYDHATGFSPFPFTLEPITRQSIAKYTACEMPDNGSITAADRNIVDQILADATVMGHGLLPQRVGLLYTAIYWLLRDNDNMAVTPTEEEWADFPVEAVADFYALHGRTNWHVAHYPVVGFNQAVADDWDASGSGDIGTSSGIIVDTTETMQKARHAVAAIAAQGEGFADNVNSHFRRFVNNYITALSTALPDGTISIALPVPVDPWYDGSNGVQQQPAMKITSAVSVDFSRLSDLIYEVLLHYIALATHNETTDATQRTDLASFCLTLMGGLLRKIHNVFPLLHLTDDASSLNISFCFSLPKDTDDSFNGIKARLNEALAEAIKLSADLASRAALPSQLTTMAATVKNKLSAAPAVI